MREESLAGVEESGPDGTAGRREGAADAMAKIIATYGAVGRPRDSLIESVVCVCG